MNYKKTILLILGFVLTISLFLGAWPAIHIHGKFAKKTESSCVPLPKPPKHECKKQVDHILDAALKNGSDKPDSRDGWSSTKHSYNPGLPWDHSWDFAIRETLNLPEDVAIDPGRALEAISKENNLTKKKLKEIKCESSLADYAKLWENFGVISHYCADLASPLHTYCIDANRIYHEGDMDKEYHWFKGLWDYPYIGPATHFRLEVNRVVGALMSTLDCSILSPKETSSKARNVMKLYSSQHEPGITGYEGLMHDFFWLKLDSADIFFRTIGVLSQGNDAIGSISSEWKDVLKDWKQPQCSSSASEEAQEFECGSAKCPSPSNPDENAATGLYQSSYGNFDLLDQSWDRIAAKKNKKSLIWYWMMPYFYNAMMVGDIDENTYNQLAESYDLTAELAEETFYDDYIGTPDVAILAKGMALSFSDLLQNKFNEPIRRYTLEDFTPDAIKDYPIFIIPTGGLTGLENSEIFKEKLSQYVNRGGIVIVFDQQYGYEFSALPVPQEFDGSYKKLNGYGWEEDQACFTNAAYLNVYHQIFSGQTQTIPSLNIDG